MPRKRTEAGLPPKDWSGFHGFFAPHYTQTPDALFDEVMPYLTGAELKCLLYIVRHTFGFKKEADQLSLEQFCKGIITREGRRLDWGTGLARTTATDALKALKGYGLIIAEEQRETGHGTKGSQPTLYRLRLEGGPLERNPPVRSIDAAARKSVPAPVRSNGTTRNKGSRNKGSRNNTRNEIPLANKYTRGRYALCERCNQLPCGCANA